MGEPRTTREALIAQILGDLDGLLTRAEQLPAAIAEAETRLAISSQVLSDAGDKYRMAVTVFTEEAKSTLNDYLRQKASQMGALPVEEQRAILQEAARGAFQFAASERINQHKAHAQRSAGERRGLYRRLFEHCVTALLASLITAALVLLIVAFS